MANISSINLPDGSSYNFKDSVSGYITSPNVVYCTCGTAAATAAKVATVVSGTFTSADLVAGAQVLVKFTYANGVASPTLNVNSTGAKSIKRYGTTAPSTSAATSWNAGSVVLLTYDGSYWQQVGYLNSTYSEITVANATNGTGSGTGLASGRRLKAAVEAFAPVTSVNGSTGAVTVNVPTKTSDLTNDSGFITDAGVTSFNGSTGAITYTAPVTSVNGSTGAVTISVPTMTSELTNDSGFVTPLLGSTGNRTPGEVLNALQNGKPVSISHYDETFSLLSFESFNYAIAINGIVGCTIIEYGGSLYCYTLIGYVSNDTWVGSATTLAKATDIPSIPTNVSYFTNDAGYLTSYTETDPTVPSWAKASTKPSYTASEVGALASSGGQVTGDTTLYTASGNSPALIFQRGALTDNYNDWRIQDRSGFLYFDQRGISSTDWGTIAYLTQTGICGNGAGITSLNASNLASGTVPIERLPMDSALSSTSTNPVQNKVINETMALLIDAVVNGIADGELIESTMIRVYGDGVLIGNSGSPVCAFINGNGSFDIVSVTWDGDTIMSTSAIASYGQDGTVQQIKFESAIDSNGDSVAMQPDLDALEQRVATIENTDTIYGYKADEIETTRVKFVNEDTTVMVWSKEANGHLVLKKQ